MKSGNDLQAVKAYMECRERCAKAMEKKGVDHAFPFVTISREACAGGTTVAHKVVEYLSEGESPEKAWKFFDRELVQAVIEKHDLPKEMARFLTENKISEIRDIVESLLEMHPPAFALVRKTSETILHLAKIGHAVMVGRGANLVTRKLRGGLHVRLIGSVEKRVQHAEDFYKVSHAEAVEKVKAADAARKQYIRQNFDKNIEDPHLYDLVINTDHISYADAARMIADQVLRQHRL